uniref:Uncharacterized protein n=1 Tax=Rhizophora mucronata TaxID=61149 RepID=A0A2P2N4J3_RHIMU
MSSYQQSSHYLPMSLVELSSQQTLAHERRLVPGNSLEELMNAPYADQRLN